MKFILHGSFGVVTLSLKTDNVEQRISDSRNSYEVIFLLCYTRNLSVWMLNILINFHFPRLQACVQIIFTYNSSVGYAIGKMLYRWHDKRRAEFVHIDVVHLFDFQYSNIHCTRRAEDLDRCLWLAYLAYPVFLLVRVVNR